MSGKIDTFVTEKLKPLLDEEALELWDIRLSKEGKDNFLRIFIDREDGYIDTDICEKVSKYISEELDEIDDIMPNKYYLEVSSPGMDRELKTDDHLRRYLGEIVEVKLYSGIDGKKVFCGKLDDFSDEELKITEIIQDLKKKTEIEKPRSFDRKKIAKINLAVIL
ncbi:hypothetical protein HMPREF1635_05915 [Clostridiales bacterium S5-A14a]|nr:hypothetical protein HMPREF1635_05915 [Clostridiales bacterium S5-A14a]